MNTMSDLMKFWDTNFKSLKLDDNQKLEELCPSNKFIDLFKQYKNMHVLDYGAGIGWASYILALNNKVLSVDTSDGAIKIINHYKELHNLNIDAKVINTNWIYDNKMKFDLINSANVLDVLPLDTSREIIKAFYNMLNKDGIAIISFNYYIDLEEAKKAYLVKEKEIYIDGILRLSSLKDEEWINEFKNYFDIEKLIYFSWPGEEKESRRLFILKKK